MGHSFVNADDALAFLIGWYYFGPREQGLMVSNLYFDMVMADGSRLTILNLHSRNTLHYLPSVAHLHSHSVPSLLGHS